MKRFFIIGNPRSGTSLLRLMLNQHSEIIVPPEAGFMVYFFNKYYRKNLKLAQNHKSCIKDIQNSKKFNFWKLNLYESSINSKLQKTHSYLELCDKVYALYANQQKKKYLWIGDKNNFHIDYINLLSSNFPNCKFIHIVRDGRDIAASYNKLEKLRKPDNSFYFPKIPKSVKDISINWKNNLNKIDEEFSKISENRTITIKYEDLVNKPVEILEIIMSYLGLKFDIKMLNYHHNNRLKFDEPIEFYDWKKNTFNPLSNKRVGTHLSVLSKSEIEIFESYSREKLEKFGYL